MSAIIIIIKMMIEYIIAFFILSLYWLVPTVILTFILSSFGVSDDTAITISMVLCSIGYMIIKIGNRDNNDPPEPHHNPMHYDRND